MKYSTLFDSIVANYAEEELLHICKGLNKNYNIFDPEDVRWKKIAYYLFKSSDAEIENLRNTVLSNWFINDLFLKFYICERVVKYYLIKKLLGLTNDIVAFEMGIGDSRIDVCRINGGSYAYEIKTEYDSFERLSSQMNDYMKAFEKVYVVVPKSRIAEVESLIPNGCGIISYRHAADNSLVFSYFKHSEKNQCDINTCLSSLSSNDLSELLKLAGLKNKGAKEEKLKVIVKYSEHHSIWPAYRRLLKEKYRLNWQFLKDHFEEIVPIDIQSFFSANMSPAILYGTQKERS